MDFDRARSLALLGQVTRRAGKRAAARGYLEAAAAVFGQLGCDSWGAPTHADLARLGTSKRGRAGELTAAERRVAVLAAGGLADKEIARRLFITVHTVEVHLAHAFAKLGVRSRTWQPRPRCPPGPDRLGSPPSRREP